MMQNTHNLLSQKLELIFEKVYSTVIGFGNVPREEHSNYKTKI